MKLKDLAEKVNKLPDKIEFIPLQDTMIYNSISEDHLVEVTDFKDDNLRHYFTKIQLELVTTEFVLKKVCNAYNILRDIILDLDLE